MKMYDSGLLVEAGGKQRWQRSLSKPFSLDVPVLKRNDDEWQKCTSPWRTGHR